MPGTQAAAAARNRRPPHAALRLDGSVGIVPGALVAATLSMVAEWEEWINLVGGPWLIVLPRLLAWRPIGTR
jgi:hypothetical protein